MHQEYIHKLNNSYRTEDLGHLKEHEISLHNWLGGKNKGKKEDRKQDRTLTHPSMEELKKRRMCLHLRKAPHQRGDQLGQKRNFEGY